MQKASKRFSISFIVVSLLMVLLLGGLVVFVDPYFHYHKPINGIRYVLDNERYQNDGIVKNFDYNAIITGSSMTENFKTSECDAIFGVSSIKVPFAGGSFKEINSLLRNALSHNNNVKMVIRGLDYNRLFNDKDYVDYDENSYPQYLYDDILINDVKYIFNKTVLLQALQNLAGLSANGEIKELSFDTYANWMPYYTCSKETVNAYYGRDTLTYYGYQQSITDEEYATIEGNIKQNVINLAVEYPNTQFYYYFTPYNIYYMDYFYQNGEMEKQLLAEKFIIEMLLPYDNIHIYSFFTDYDAIWNIDEYRDVAHHSEDVNSLILQWISEGKGLLTKDNYLIYCDEEYDYYMNLDYDAMYAELSGRDDVILNH